MRAIGTCRLPRLTDLKRRAAVFSVFCSQLFQVLRLFFDHSAEIIVVQAPPVVAGRNSVCPVNGNGHGKNGKTVALLFIEVFVSRPVSRPALFLKGPAISVDTADIGVHVPLQVGVRRIGKPDPDNSRQTGEHTKKKHDRKNPPFFLPRFFLRGNDLCCLSGLKHHLLFRFPFSGNHLYTCSGMAGEIEQDQSIRAGP